MKFSVALPVPPPLVSLATIVCGPCDRPVGVNVQLPLPSAVAVWAIGEPSIVKCTVAPGSPPPLSASSLVISRPSLVSSTRAMLTFGAGGSTLIGASRVVVALPAASVVTVERSCAPKASGCVVNVHAPLENVAAPRALRPIKHVHRDDRVGSDRFGGRGFRDRVLGLDWSDRKGSATAVTIGGAVATSTAAKRLVVVLPAASVVTVLQIMHAVG